MMTVASLFESQAEATKALDALPRSGFEDIDYRVYEGNVADEGGQVVPVAFPNTQPDVGAVTPLAMVGDELSDIDDEGLADFFREAVKTGRAVLVVAEVEEDRATTLERFFREHGGRTAQDQ